MVTETAEQVRSWQPWKHYGMGGYIRYKNNHDLTARASETLTLAHLNGLEAQLEERTQELTEAKAVATVHLTHAAGWMERAEQAEEKAKLADEVYDAIMLNLVGHPWLSRWLSRYELNQSGKQEETK